jgi:hypothetical protein
LGAGEKARSETLSVGGESSATSALRSPTVVLAAELDAPPKSVDMVAEGVG